MTGSDHAAHGAASALEDIARDQHLGVTAAVRAECQHLQTLEDAIAYRRARVSAPCPDCTASGPMCDDHACDLDLIAAYQQTAIAILNASSQTDVIREPPRQPPRRNPARPAQPPLNPHAIAFGLLAAGRKTQALANPTCGVARLSPLVS